MYACSLIRIVNFTLRLSICIDGTLEGQVSLAAPERDLGNTKP